MNASVPLRIGTRQLRLSNLDKVLYPGGFTKGQVIDYYAQIAPVLLPYLRGRAITLKRYPNGVTGPHFFEKNCPPHRPPWVQTAAIAAHQSRHGAARINYCVINDAPSLLWAANLAALELHVPLALARAPQRPTMMVFDLDPGAPAGILDCARVALALRDVLRDLGLLSVIKSSGAKGLHVYVPLSQRHLPFAHTKQFAHAIALMFQRRDPARVTATMSKRLRGGRVLIDWSQNDRHKTTVCPYSLRATHRPMVSAPLDWDEIDAAVRRGDASGLSLNTQDVLLRIGHRGDLFAPLLNLRQRLPSL